jgi:uncharacterized protein (DUF305 family)
VIDAQSAEIALMQGWLKDWYGVDYSPMSMLGNASPDTASSMEGMDMSNSDNMGGMEMGNSDDMGGMEMGNSDDMGGMGMMMDMMMNMKMGDMMDMMENMPGMENMTMMDMMGMMMDMMMNMKMGDMMSMMQDMPDMENITMMDMMGMMMQHGMMEQPSDSGTEHQGHNQDQPAQGDEHSQHHPAQAGGDPVMMMGMMAGLSNLEGVEYEIAWLEAMIDHHDDALHMSNRILKFDTIHPELAELAQNIIAAQTAEIGTMEQLITELSGS